MSTLHLVEAEKVELSQEVDPGWADAEHGLLLQPALSVHRADCHGCWESRRHHDGNDVQRTQHDLGRVSLKEGTEYNILNHDIQK